MILETVELLKCGGIQARAEYDTITVPIAGRVVLRCYRVNGVWWAGAFDISQVVMTEVADLPTADVPADCRDAERIAVYVIRCLFRYGNEYGKGLVPQYVKK